MPVTRPRSYAAIDLGTNNCRLLIARPQNGELVVIDAFSRIVRLGEGLHGHWVQAYYTHLFVTDAGGRVFADVQDDRVIFAATLPV